MTTTISSVTDVTLDGQVVEAREVRIRPLTELYVSVEDKTTTDGVTVTAPVEEPESKPESPPETLPMNRNILRALGSCDTGVRQFRKAFPGDDVTVEIRQTVCAEAAAHLDWTWIVEHMLTYEGQQEFHRIKESRSQRYVHLGNTARVRRASVFGWLFENHPQYRSPNIVNAVLIADERADEVLLHDHRRAQRSVQSMKDRITEYRRALDQWARELPRLEASVVETGRQQAEVLARVTERRIKQSAARLAEHERQMAGYRAQHDALVASATRELEGLRTTEAVVNSV